MAQISQFRPRPKKPPAPPPKKRRGVYLSVPVWVALVAGIALLKPDSGSKELGISEIAPVRLAISQRFNFCSWSSQSYCVIDGDTIRYAGTKVRIEDIDTPEIHNYKCDSELERGLLAKSRLLELINAGPFEIVYSGGRDEDQYGPSSAGLYVTDFHWENSLSMKVSPDVMQAAAAPGVYRTIIVIDEGV